MVKQLLHIFFKKVYLIRRQIIKHRIPPKELRYVPEEINETSHQQQHHYN